MTPKSTPLNARRQWLSQVGLAGLVPVLGSTPVMAEQPKATSVRFCFNTATLRGQKKPLSELVEVVAKAGYHAIEPWMGEIETHRNSGKSLKDLGKQIRDAGLEVPSAIGFAEWISEDPVKRKKGLEQAKKDMELVREIGGTRIAAPPSGATQTPVLDLDAVTERYATLLKLGREVGIIPQLEMWGFSKNLSRTSEVAQVALNTGDPSACILADIYHIHKGGSSLNTIQLLSAQALQVFHMNDFPANPTREKIVDADRVYPGDGVAPLGQILSRMILAGFRGYLSLELFNPNYYKEDALVVANTGLAKMKAVVAKAMA